MQFGDLDVTINVNDDSGVVVRIAPCHEWEVGQQQTAECLAQVLAPNAYWTEGAVAGITYDADLDRRIVALIDLLATIRCSVPHMVQLELDIDVDRGKKLERLLQSALPGVQP